MQAWTPGWRRRLLLLLRTRQISINAKRRDSLFMTKPLPSRARLLRGRQLEQLDALRAAPLLTSVFVAVDIGVTLAVLGGNGREHVVGHPDTLMDVLEGNGDLVDGGNSVEEEIAAFSEGRFGGGCGKEVRAEVGEVFEAFEVGTVIG
jgi:hypothetical protein